MKDGMTVTRDDVAKLLKNIEAMTGKQVQIGIPAEGNSRRGDPIGNAAIGYIQENGSPANNIPARPFLVPGVEQATPKAIQQLKKAAAAGLENAEAVDRGLNAAGLIAQTAVKNRIRNSVGFAPLAPSTIAARQAKGAVGTKPLIRTGQLLNSITYVVKG